jgi:hypothetical protein
VLTPPLGGETVSIVYTSPTGSTTTHTQTTDGAGTYTDTFKPTATGVWHVQSHWAGDSAYLTADSPTCTLTVGRRSSAG